MRSPKSIELYELLIRRGYPVEFADEITKSLNTDFTAKRMIGYLSYYKNPPLEQVVDEMLAILSDREQIIQKKQLETYNAAYNDFLQHRDELDEE